MKRNLLVVVFAVLILLVGVIALSRPERGYGANANQATSSLEGSAYQTIQFTSINWYNSWNTSFLGSNACSVQTCQNSGGCSVAVTWNGGTLNLFLDKDAYGVVCGDIVTLATTGNPYPAP
jgi:hypothetical protein